MFARDQQTGREHEFLTHAVINAAGPQVETVAERFASPVQGLFKPSLAWNLLVDREPLSDAAVAIQAPARGSRVYFAHSLAGRLVVGTGHAGLTGRVTDASVKATDIDAMLEGLNAAVPSLGLESREIVRVFSGLLPVRTPGSVELADVATVVDHSKLGGPQGLVSVAGVKYTTARSTTAKVVEATRRTRKELDNQRPGGLPERPSSNPFRLQAASDVERARAMVKTEAPQTLSDLLIRRGDLVFTPEKAVDFAELGCAAFGWDESRCHEETQKLVETISSTFIVK